MRQGLKLAELCSWYGQIFLEDAYRQRHSRWSNCECHIAFVSAAGVGSSLR